MQPHQNESKQIYRFDRYLTLVILGLALAYIPLESLVELTANGTIDFTRTGNGRIKIPYWCTLLVTWPVFLYFLAFFFFPAIKFIARGFVFEIDGQVLRIGNLLLRRQEIISWRKSRLGGILIESKKGSVRVESEFSTGGTDGLCSFLEKVAP